MRKHFLLIAAAVFVVGGLASNSSSSSKHEQNDLQNEVATLPSFVIPTVPAMANYTPVEVIRPKTELFVVKHEMEMVPAIVAAVIPVAHGSPVTSC